MTLRSIKGFHSRSQHNDYTHLPESISLFFQNNSKSKSIKKCKQIHAKLIILSNTISETYPSNTLLNFYSRCGDLNHAHLLFDQIPHKNVVSWTSMISSYVHHGYFQTSLKLFKEMLQSSNENPNQFTFSVTIRACVNLNYLKMGMQIHGLIIGFGLEREEFAGSSLVDMYFKIGGGINEAYRIFHGLFYRDSVSWNVMISGFAQSGEFDEVLRLFYEMQVFYGLSPNDFTFTSLLKCCKCILEIEQVHGLALKSGIDIDLVVGSALVDCYGKCGNFGSSRKVLDFMGDKDNFAWSSIISGYSRNGCGEEALSLFRDMIRQGTRPDQHALSSSLKACVEIDEIETGIQIHSQMIKNGYQGDWFVASVLTNLYAKCNQLDAAEKVFIRISDRDIVAWNSMIMGFAQMEDGSGLECMKLYREFRQTTMLKPDGATLVAVLKSFRNSQDLNMGRQIHAEIMKSSHSSETCVGNAVISMYSKCEAFDDSRKAFDDGMVNRDEVSWSSIIGSYSQNGFELEALKLCNEMLADGISLSSYSLPSCISACTGLAAIDLGKQFHTSMIKLGFGSDIYVRSSVVDMYAKCGFMEDSVKVFNEEEYDQNVVTFNALISGLAQHGRVQESIEEFKTMEEKNITPNKITFLAVLSACSHAGLVEESLFFFDLMRKKYRIDPESDHYSCLVDVFGRAGRLKEAYQIMGKTSGVSGWRTLLSACRNYGETEMGEKCAKRVMEVDPNDHASYILLSNLYSEMGRWKEAEELRHKMTGSGVRKEPGSSMLIIRD